MRAGRAVFKAIADFSSVRKESKSTARALDRLSKSADRVNRPFGSLVRGLASTGTFLGRLAGALSRTLPLLFLLGGAAIAASSSVLALAGSLTGILGLLVILPGLLTGMAMAGLAVGLALVDIKKHLAGLAPGFKALQDSVSDAFWAEAASPIREMVNELLPSFSDGLTKLGRSMGQMTGDVAKAMQKSFRPEDLRKMFDYTNEGIQQARAGMAPLINSFAVLGRVGAKYLPRLGKSFADLMTRYDAFLTRAEKDGSLERWAENGITVLKELGRLVKNTGSILGSLFKAAQNAAPPDALIALNDGLERFSRTLKRPEVQEGLTKVFQSAYRAMALVQDGIAKLGPALAKLGPALGNGLEKSGEILGRIVGYIAEIASQPEFAAGLTTFFNDVNKAVALLQPVMAPLGRLLGNLLPVLGEVVKTAASVLREMAPVIDSFATDVLPALTPILKELSPVLVELIKLISPPLVAFLKELGGALKDGAPGIKAGADSLKSLKEAIDGLPLAFTQFSLGDKEGGFMTLMQFAVDHPEVVSFFKLLGAALKGFASDGSGLLGLATFLSTLGTGMSVLTSEEGLPKATGVVAGFVTKVDEMFLLTERWNTFWAGLAFIVQTLFPGVGTTVQTTLSTLGFGFSLFTTATKPGWDGFWNGVPLPVQLAMSFANGTLTGGLGGLTASLLIWMSTSSTQWSVHWASLAAPALVGIAQANNGASAGLAGMAVTFGIGVASMYQQWERGFGQIIEGARRWMSETAEKIRLGVPLAVSHVSNMPAKMAGEILAGTWRFVSAGAALIQGFIDGITSKQNPVIAAVSGIMAAARRLFPNSPAKEGPFSGRGWTPYSGAALVDGFGEGMVARTRALKKTAASVLGNAGLAGEVYPGASALLAGSPRPGTLAPFAHTVSEDSLAPAPAAGPGVNVEKLEINNPRPERASDSLPRAVRKVGYVGVGSNA